ncbi:acyl carrier protein [Actinocrispum wychmicini]|uniref:Aryl carrier-like protein n=1 Tax=Actinocrispum wychmicini TaxID=1213861 RepID=A0A4R2IHS3_9PSEU|nr:acyl carrier protein [Actinocrispum wychmicini]TCO43736.1 aryl carrier-like protein [Actinocrispum wychmicini]
MDAATARSRITEAWEKVLGHTDFTDDDDFFAVGGDSMGAILLVRKLNKAGVAVELADLMTEPTVAALVAAASAEPDGPERPQLRRIPR